MRFRPNQWTLLFSPVFFSMHTQRNIGTKTNTANRSPAHTQTQRLSYTHTYKVSHTRTHTNIHSHTRTYSHTVTHILSHTHTQTHKDTHTHIHSHTHKHTHLYTHTDRHTRPNTQSMFTHTQTHTRSNTQSMYTHTQTHKRPNTQSMHTYHAVPHFCLGKKVITFSPCLNAFKSLSRVIPQWATKIHLNSFWGSKQSYCCVLQLWLERRKKVKEINKRSGGGFGLIGE